MLILSNKPFPILQSRSHEQKCPNWVEEHSAVTLEFSTAEMTETFILDNTIESPKRNEINQSDKRFRQLLGKKIGEEIIWKENSISVQKAKIIAIRTKWHHANLETLKALEVRFASEDLNFGRYTPEEVMRLLQEQLKHRKLINDFFYNIAEGQKNGNYSPMGMVAGFLKMSPLELHDIYSNNASLGIRCADGSDNLEEVLEKIADNKAKKLVADIFGILTLYRLNIGQEIIDGFGKVRITKSTYDEIDKAYSLANFDLAREISSSAFDEKGQLYQRYYTKEEKQKIFNYYDGLMKWVGQYCEVIPFVLDKKLMGEKEYDVFTKSSSDTLLMAIQHKMILISDDFIYRKRAEGRYKVTSIWSQALLLYLWKEQNLEIFSYHNRLVNLINANYNYVNFNQYTLIVAANQSPEIFSKLMVFAEHLRSMLY